MKVTYNDMQRMNDLEARYPDVDWFAILADGGIEAVEEYADFVENR